MVTSSGKPSQQDPEQCPMLTPILPLPFCSCKANPRLYNGRRTLLWEGCVTADTGALRAQVAVKNQIALGRGKVLCAGQCRVLQLLVSLARP